MFTARQLTALGFKVPSQLPRHYPVVFNSAALATAASPLTQSASQTQTLPSPPHLHTASAVTQVSSSQSQPKPVGLKRKATDEPDSATNEELLATAVSASLEPEGSASQGPVTRGQLQTQLRTAEDAGMGLTDAGIKRLLQPNESFVRSKLSDVAGTSESSKCLSVFCSLTLRVTGGGFDVLPEGFLLSHLIEPSAVAISKAEAAQQLAKRLELAFTKYRFDSQSGLSSNRSCCARTDSCGLRSDEVGRRLILRSQQAERSISDSIFRSRNPKQMLRMQKALLQYNQLLWCVLHPLPRFAA